MKKKRINLLLTLSMVFAVIGFIGCDKDKGDGTQSSVEPTLPPTDVIYTLIDDETHYMATGLYNTEMTEIYILDEYGGLPVTEIGSYAFADCYNLTSVTMGDNVTTIGRSAFRNCISLTSIDIPDSVTSIGWDAFYNCRSLTSIDIPDSVTTVGEDAFYNCSRLTSVTIGKSVTSIGSGAFTYCDALTEINFNATAMNDLSSSGQLSYFAGQDGTGITVTIGANVTKIPAYLFRDYNVTYAPKITSVVFEEGSVCTSIGLGAFGGCSGLTSIDIPDCVTEIGASAFYGCSGLTSIDIPDCVTEIGASAFYGCSNLTKVNYRGTIDGWVMIDFGDENANPLYYAKKLNINDVEVTEVILTTATKIKKYAFYDCYNLTNITIPDGVTEIGERAFSGCSSLTSVVIPDSVTTIGSSAFYGCSGLTIYCEAASKPSGWSSSWVDEDCSAVWNYAGTTATENGIRYALTKDGTMTVCGYEGAATEIEIASTVQGYAVTAIKEKVFREKSNLMSVDIPDGVTEIGERAFERCISLRDVTIGDGVISIGEYAFYNCYNLRSITVGEENTVYKSIDGNLYSKDEKTLIQYAVGKSETTFKIPGSVTSIGSYAFYGCRNLTSITIGDSVTMIGRYAFGYCRGLTSVTIGNGVTEIGGGAFEGCRVLTEINFNATAMNDLSSSDNLFDFAGQDRTGITVTIGANVTKIPAYLFRGYNTTYAPKITSVIFEEGSVCTSIGLGAFGGCSSLSYNKYDNGLYLGNENNPYLVLVKAKNEDIISCAIPTGTKLICSYAFSGCSSLTSVVIPDSVTEIGAWVFWGCRSLMRIDIPDGVTEIGERAFSGCSSLTSVVIPDSVTTIGSFAFYGCRNLTSITIGDSVTMIGGYAFGYCSGLTSVVIPDSVTTIGSGAFEDCSSLTRVYYGGASTQWSTIRISDYNAPLTNAMRYYYSENAPTGEGNYWRYVDGVPTVWA